MKKTLLTLIAAAVLTAVPALADRPLPTLADFSLSKAEAAAFAKGAAAVPGEYGLSSNRAGVAAFMATDELREGGQARPLDFTWSGPTQTTRLFDGTTRRLANGSGEMVVKYADDDTALQRYKGAMRDGLWHGRGALLARADYQGGAFWYEGDFVRGHMEGTGTYVSVDFLGRSAPFKYEGEFLDDTFHGRGTMVDLRTGAVIHSGLWLEGFPFNGTLKAWQKENKQVEVLYAQRHYNDPRSQGQVEMAGGGTGGEAITSLGTAASAGQD